MDVLADDHWFQSDLHDPTRARISWHAATYLYLSGFAGLDLDEHGLNYRRVFHGSRVHSFRVGFSRESLPRKTGRRQSVERVDAGMGDDFTAASRKFRRAPADSQPTSALGLCKPRSSGSSRARWRSD